MNLTADTISQAIDQSWCDYFVQFKPFAAVDYADGPEVLRFFSGLPHPFFNPIMRARLPADHLDEAIEDTLDFVRQHALTSYWWVGPLTQPADLGPRLEAHGLRLDDHEIGMAVDLAELNEEPTAPPLTGLRVEQVCDAAGLEEYLPVFAVGFEMEPYMTDFFRQAMLGLGFASDAPFRLYLARLDGRPVGCSALLLSNDIAGIYNVATLPEARRQGVGRACTLLPLQIARSEGYHLAVLQASEMGVPVYRRLGFQVYCDILAYEFKS